MNFLCALSFFMHFYLKYTSKSVKICMIAKIGECFHFRVATAAVFKYAVGYR